MSQPALRERRHFYTELPILVRESFGNGTNWFLGCQWANWQRDERGWDFRLGRYRMATAFFRIVPANLRLATAELETLDHDQVLRLPTGTPLLAQCEALYGNPAGFEFRLYDSTGAVAVTKAGPSGTLLGAVADGSYILWARVYEIPFEEFSSGEWAAVRVVVGDGEWDIPAGTAANPGCPLYAKPADASLVTLTAENETDYRALFDVMARSVSASCVLHSPLETAGGTVLAPAGAQLVAGLRASQSGPQAAVWWLHDDLSATLLGMTAVYSNGMCECGKSDHHASDLAQDPNGTLWLLNECSLHRFAPDAPSVEQRLPGDPERTGGHPGGQCLRFYEGRNIYSTEKLTALPEELGPFIYNRVVLRVAGQDVPGPGTIWHGPNFAEIYQGRWWACRMTSDDLASPDTQVILDTLVNNRWSEGGGTRGGIQRPASAYRWRQLCRRGSQLFAFGFTPGGNDDGTDDIPRTAVIDGRVFREVSWPWFVRRATRCRDANGAETLSLVANREVDGNGNSYGFPSRWVVELSPEDGGGTGGGNKLCFIWNDGAGEFRLSRSQFEAAGGDPDLLPPFLKWLPAAGNNGGGVWRPSDAEPTTGHWLVVSVATTYLALTPGENGLPYDLEWWGRICLTINSDGSSSWEPEPQPTDENAEDVLEHMPEGTGWRHVRLTVPNPWMPLSAVICTDPAPGKPLAAERDDFPILWGRGDSDAPFDDLSSYTQLLHFGRTEMTEEPRTQHVDAVVIVRPDLQPAALPALQRRI